MYPGHQNDLTAFNGRLGGRTSAAGTLAGLHAPQEDGISQQAFLVSTCVGLSRRRPCFQLLRAPPDAARVRYLHRNCQK